MRERAKELRCIFRIESRFVVTNAHHGFAALVNMIDLNSTNVTDYSVQVDYQRLDSLLTAEGKRLPSQLSGASGRFVD